MPCLLRVVAMSSASFSSSTFGSVHLILQGAVQLPGRSKDAEMCMIARGLSLLFTEHTEAISIFKGSGHNWPTCLPFWLCLVVQAACRKR